MSSPMGLTPLLRLKLEDSLLGRRCPEDGYMEGAVDTGYQSFIAVPQGVFGSLSMAELRTADRVAGLAYGTEVESRVGCGTATVEGTGVELDGPVETMPGLAEAPVGTRLVSRFSLDSDYRLRRTSIAFCG